MFLRGVFDVRVYDERVGFTVDVFDGNLETIEAPGFGRCDLCVEVAAEVFVDDAI